MNNYKKKLSLLLCFSLVLGLLSWRLLDVPISNAEDYNISNPRIEDGISTWDCVYFGYYFQSGDTVKEPIKWRVLSVDENDVFLLADQNLDCQQYNKTEMSVTWKTCTLRTWLNETFLNNAFTKEEQKAIQTTNVQYEQTLNTTEDQVYLLSQYEVQDSDYGFTSNANNSDTRVAKNTAYAKAQGALTSSLDEYNGNGDWWLRLIDNMGIGSYNAPWTSTKGSVHINTYIARVNTNDIAVRPALHLNLSATSEWSYAGTVSSNGEENALPSPTPIPTAEPTPPPTPTPSPTPTVTPTPTPVPSSGTEAPDTEDKNSPAPTGDKKEPSISSPPKTVTAPGKPKKLSVKNKKKKSVTVSWKKVKGAKGYQVQYAANTHFSKKKVKNTKKTKLVIKKLKKKKTYCFRVRAYKTSNGVKKYGKWSKVKKVKIKK